ncbi:MAG: tetratricopeptide repeat protein [Saprospiraceae bacterium]
MPINYNLYRFGVDEFAVGHLINGDFPTEDEARWRIVDAPRYHIERLLNEHLRAQEVLRTCKDSGTPFVLFLRSFSSEQKNIREEKDVFSRVSFHSISFQKWIKDQLAERNIPLVKLHGGSDGFYSGTENEANILSTHAYNWKSVAEELIKAASAIVFLVSHVTAGVAEEFDLIRKFTQEDRSLVVWLDPSETPDPASSDSLQIEKTLADFPHVFQLNNKGEIVSPNQFISLLQLRLKDAATTQPIEHSPTAVFTYLEPDFIASEEYHTTERIIWKGLRLLRVVFEDTYWAALKAHGISFQHFKFPQYWIIAHQMYGLAIAAADFKAIREALRYLSILYIFRGADFALLIDPLAAKYDQLARQIFLPSEPDLEEKYTPEKDVLKFPAKLDVAIKIFEYAQEADKERDLETAMHLYQAAVIIALKSDDTDANYRNWVIANMCRDWAGFQTGANQPLWAVTNSAFAVKLFRDLVATDSAQYLQYLAPSLNDLGTRQFNLQYYTAAELAFEEALAIRRTLPTDLENYSVDVYNSLANLALLKVELGKTSIARALYNEALAVCEKEVSSNPRRMGDLIRLQCWMCICVSKIPDAGEETKHFGELTAYNFARFSTMYPDEAANYTEFVKEASRLSSQHP